MVSNRLESSIYIRDAFSNTTYYFRTIAYCFIHCFLRRLVSQFLTKCFFFICETFLWWEPYPRDRNKIRFALPSRLTCVYRSAFEAFSAIEECHERLLGEFNHCTERCSVHWRYLRSAPPPKKNNKKRNFNLESRYINEIGVL